MRPLSKTVVLCGWLVANYSGLTVADEAIPVVAKPLSSLAIYPELKVPANVISNNDSRISAEISARITAIPVRVGEVVAKGAEIARLEQRDYQLALDHQQATLEALEARVDLAQYELKRAQSLAEKQAVSEQLLKQREAELNTLLAERKGQQAAFEQAQWTLDKTVLRAPFKAVVTERLGQVGELVAPGAPVLRIVDASNLEVSARIQAWHANDLAQAKSLNLLSAGRRYPLLLRVITPVIDSRTRTREARLLFEAETTLPGTAGELVWEHSLASLPADLLIKRQGQLGVFTLRGNQAHFVALPTAEEGRPALTELAADTLIITEGRFRLQDQDTVLAK